MLGRDFPADFRCTPHAKVPFLIVCFSSIWRPVGLQDPGLPGDHCYFRISGQCLDLGEGARLTGLSLANPGLSGATGQTSSLRLQLGTAHDHSRIARGLPAVRIYQGAQRRSFLDDLRVGQAGAAHLHVPDRGCGCTLP